jgi:cell division protein FtsA
MSNNKPDKVLAIDIGTRTVIGVVAAGGEGRLEIIAQEMVEHQGRAMYDGQIHDIPRVARAVAQVKHALEERTGGRFAEAAIAAAGRALKTRRCEAAMEVNPLREITEDAVRALEFEALRHAREEIKQQDQGAGDFYCVGHGVIGYRLDGLELTSLIGHRGRVIATEAIATFLPASVVNSLFSVLRRVGLEPSYITLEPIAALEVTIPEEMRLLNLVLVDVGAGTSDIAITRDGTIVGYGMVPVAGDEITEAVAETCVVDFRTAEDIKRSMSASESLTFRDVLQSSVTIPCREVLEAIGPAVDHLASAVSEAVLALNGGQTPKSVICIGGGAQTPTFLSKLAHSLGLPENRVGMRKRSQLSGIIAPEEDVLNGPEGITVAGIAQAALKRKGLNLIGVQVNGRDYRIFNPGDLRVVDCLALLDHDPRTLFGTDGKDLRFYVNGQETVVYGELARPAVILVNGGEAHLQAPVEDGCRIEVIPAVNGRDAVAKAGDYFAGAIPLQVYVGGREISLPPVCLLNDAPVDFETQIREGDRLRIEARYTVGQVLALSGLDPGNVDVSIGGVKVDPDYILKPGDTLVPADKRQPAQAADDSRNGGTGGPEAGINPNGLRVTVNGQEIIMTGLDNPLFLDVLRYVDLSLDQPQGRIKVLLNDRPARYTEKIKDGDVVVIEWE